MIVFLMTVAHLRAVLSDPGIVPLPKTALDFSDIHSGKQSLVRIKSIEAKMTTFFSNTCRIKTLDYFEIYQIKMKVYKKYPRSTQ